MKTINKLTAIVSLVSAIIAIILGVYTDFLKDENKNLANNLYQKEIEYTNEKGKLVKEVTEIRLTNKELKQIINKKDSELSEFERKIKQVTNEMTMQKTKAKNIESAGIIGIENRLQDAILLIDTVYKDVPVKHAEIITPIEHIKLTFNPQTDSLVYDFSIRNDIYFAVIRKCKIKDNGKDHWPKWGKLWGWDYYLQTKSVDSIGTIKDAILIRNTNFTR